MIPDNLEELLKGRALPKDKASASANAELLVLRTLKEHATTRKFYDQAEFFNQLYTENPVPEESDSSTFREGLIDDFLKKIQLPPGGYSGKKFKDWTPSKLFSTSGTSFADIIHISETRDSNPPILPCTVDVKSTSKKKPSGNNGLSIPTLEKLCRSILKYPKKAEIFNHTYVGVQHDTDGTILDSKVHDLFRINPESMSFNSYTNQLLINPLSADQKFTGTKSHWADLVLEKIEQVRIQQTVRAITMLHNLNPEVTTDIVDMCVNNLQDPKAVENHQILFEISHLFNRDDEREHELNNLAEELEIVLGEIETRMPSLWSEIEQEGLLENLQTMQDGKIGWGKSLRKLSKHIDNFILKALRSKKQIETIELVENRLQEVKDEVLRVTDDVLRTKHSSRTIRSFTYINILVIVILIFSLWMCKV